MSAAQLQRRRNGACQSPNTKFLRNLKNLFLWEKKHIWWWSQRPKNHCHCFNNRKRSMRYRKRSMRELVVVYEESAAVHKESAAVHEELELVHEESKAVHEDRRRSVRKFRLSMRNWRWSSIPAQGVTEHPVYVLHCFQKYWHKTDNVCLLTNFLKFDFLNLKLIREAHTYVRVYIEQMYICIWLLLFNLWRSGC